MQEQYTLEEWIGMLEEAGLDEAEVMKQTPELQAAIKKYRQSLGPQGKTDPNRNAQVMPAVNKPKTSEAYTLEEWLGMLEEAGYSLEEGSVEDETKVLKAALSAKGGQKTLGKGMADIEAALKRLQAARKAAKANESYTLEEWMGMMEEAGYSLDERNMANKAAKDAYIMKVGRVHGPSGMSLSQAAGQIDREAKQSGRSFRRSIQARDPLAKREPGQMERRVKAGEYDHYLEEAGYDTNDMDEGKLSRLAAGLGLAGAAMMGGARDAGAQQATPTKAPNDSVQTATSRDMGLALDKAGFELARRRISQQGARQDVRQNPDGTFTATIDARKRPATQAGGTPQMEERYSLEEWLGMLEEAGYSLEEGFMDSLRSAGRQVRDTAKGAGRLAGAVGAAALGGDARSALRYVGSDMKTAYNTGAAVGRGADTKYEPGRQDIGHTGQKGSVGAGIKNVFRNLRSYGQPADKPDYAAITRDARSGQLKKGVDKQIQSDKDPLAYRHYEPSESYTLEEWMGMLEEAGYDVSEYSLWRPKESGAKSTGVMKDPKKPKTPPAEPTKPKKKLDELSPEFKANYATAAADRANKIAAAANAGTIDKSTAHKKLDKTAKALRTADNATINKYGADKQNATIQQARTQVRDAGQTIREEKKTINENTVSRLQQLAGITPTE